MEKPALPAPKSMAAHGDAKPSREGPEPAGRGDQGHSVWLRLRTILLPFFLGSTCGMLSLLVIVTVVRSPSDRATASSHLAQEAPTPGADWGDSPAEVIGTAGGITRADQLVHEGQIAQALKLLVDLAKGSDSSAPAAVSYRMAVCLEALGDHDTALQLYQRLAGEKPNAAFGDIARLAQARVHLAADQLAAAKALLYDLVLEVTDVKKTQGIIYADALHLLAQALSRDTAPTEDDDLMEDTQISRPPPIFSPVHALRLMEAQQGNGSPTSELAGPSFEISRRMGTEVEGLYVNVQFQRMPVDEVVGQLAKVAELKLSWTNDSQESLLGRNKSGAIHNVSATSLFDALLDPFELAWFVSDSTLVIRSAAELSDEELQMVRRDRAARSLKNAISQHPEHALSPHAFLCLGNLDFDDGRAADAVSRYDQLLRQFPRSGIMPDAWFNVAKAQLARGNLLEAREAFFRVVDEAPGQHLESVSYLFAGRLFLESGRPDSAIRPLVRALSMATDADQRAVAATTLASAYLMSTRVYAANLVLVENKDLLTRQPHEDIAAFLSAMARFQAATDEPQAVSAGRSLMSAVANVELNQLFGRHFLLLLGQAYEELGLADEAAEVYERELDGGLRGELRDELLFSLSRIHSDIGDMDNAQHFLRQLNESGTVDGVRRAQLKLAEFALLSDDYEDCFELCRKLLNNGPTDRQKEAALQLMGHAFERQDEHYKAALCFAGMIPGDSDEDQQQTLQIE